MHHGKFVSRKGIEVVATGTHDGLDLKVVKHLGLGHLCGYVRVPEDHPWHNKLYDDECYDDVVVHGGLTYSEAELGEWWIGFDCAHLGDYIPAIGHTAKDGRHWSPEGVRAETESLARQVAGAA
ncbi:MAG: hypothetical protein WAS05_09130 [Candidatus Nanopelagicales bacterium]